MINLACQASRKVKSLARFFYERTTTPAIAACRNRIAGMIVQRRLYERLDIQLRLVDNVHSLVSLFQCASQNVMQHCFPENEAAVTVQ